MPFYVYCCKNCDYEKEIFMTMKKSETYTETCKCGTILQRKPCSFGVQYKGTGYYTTDYKNKK